MIKPEAVERAITRIGSAVLSRGGGFVDVGAHAGRHALPWCESVGPAGLGIAIDANPVCVLWLTNSKNRDKLAQLQVVDAIVSDEEGGGVFYPADRPGLSSVVSSYVEKHSAARPDEIQKPRVTLDSLAALHSKHRIEVLKIDAELHEREVLAGARGLIVAHSPVVFLEHSLDESAPHTKYSATFVYDFLESLNYEVVHVSGSRVRSAEMMRTSRPAYFIGVSAANGGVEEFSKRYRLADVVAEEVAKVADGAS